MIINQTGQARKTPSHPQRMGFNNFHHSCYGNRGVGFTQEKNCLRQNHGQENKR